MNRFRSSFPAALVSCCLLLTRGAIAQDAKVEVIPPSTGKGAIAVVLSGNTGPSAHRSFAEQLASAGYYVLLADGRDFLISLGGGDFRGANGAAELRHMISRAQAAPQALPGKAAVVGFAIGGGAALKHAATSAEHIAATVVMYPNLKPLGSDLPGLATQLQVPVLVLAGAKDNVCCHAGTMELFASSPKSTAFEFISFPDSGHAFATNGTPSYVAPDADAASKKAIEFLQRLHPPKGQQ